jgi:DNA-binding NarL/FixJ family response regulator
MSKTARPIIRLLIADDHEMLREGFHMILKDNKQIKIVGEASNGLELIELAEKLKPDVIITDIKMPKMDGIEATRMLTEKYPQIAVIAFTVFQDESSIIAMLEAGAQGYLIKNSSKEELLEAVNAVFQQKSYYCRDTTTKLAHHIAKSKFNLRMKARQQVFNKREKDIIRLICEEYSNKEIATDLSVSIRTVEGYREKIQEKMQVKNTAGIVVYAIRVGFYKLNL